MFYKIINCLAQVPFEGVIVEACKGTRTCNRTCNLDRLAIQLASMDSRFFLKPLVHGTGLLSLKLRHWLYLDQILVTIGVHPLRILP